MKKTFWLLAFVLGAHILTGQTLRVIDAQEKSPLERVSIESTRLPYPLTTDDQGEVDISSLKGAQDLKLSSLGYISQTLSYAQLRSLNFVVALEPQFLSLDQVVVSASRWSQSSRELPYTISTLKEKDIQLWQPQTSADLLGQSGEVFIQKSQQGGGSPMIRGFATNRLLIAVDGVRMNNAIFRSGNLQNIISIDPLAVERSEVYFGPSSVIYGSDAIGGVMSFTTLNPKFSEGKDLLIEGSSQVRFSSANQEFGGHFDLNVGGQKWAYRGSVSYNRFGDLRMGRKGSDELLRREFVQRIDTLDRLIANPDPLVQRSSGYEQINSLQKLHYKPNAHWDFQYAFHYSTTSDYDRYDRLIQRQDGELRNAEWYYGPQVWQMNKLEVNYRKSNAWLDQMTLRASHQLFEESRHDRRFNRDSRRSRWEEVNAWALNLDLNKRLSNRHKLFYGIEGVNNQVNSIGQTQDIRTLAVSPESSRYPNASWNSLAAYANHEWEWSEHLTSQLGLRYNHFIVNTDFSDNLAFYPLPEAQSELNTGATSGHFGLVYCPSENWKLHSNLGTAFRAPNVDDLGKVFDSGDGIVVVPNPDLRPEYAYNAELGLAYLWREKIKLEGAVFYTYLDQAMVRRPFTLGGLDSIDYDGVLSQVEAIQNASFGEVLGFQVGLDYQIAQNWSWENRFNGQEGTEEINGTQGPSRHAAPWFGMSRLNFSTDKLKMQLSLHLSGEVRAEDLNAEEQSKPHIYQLDEQGNLYSPGWYRIDYRASYQINDFWIVTAGIENLTDQRYRPYSSGLVAPGRNFILSLRRKF